MLPCCCNLPTGALAERVSPSYLMNNGDVDAIPP